MDNNDNPEPSRGARTGGGDLGGDRHLEPGWVKGRSCNRALRRVNTTPRVSRFRRSPSRGEDGFERLLHHVALVMGDAIMKASEGSAPGPRPNITGPGQVVEQTIAVGQDEGVVIGEWSSVPSRMFAGPLGTTRR